MSQQNHQGFGGAEEQTSIVMGWWKQIIESSAAPKASDPDDPARDREGGKLEQATLEVVTTLLDGLCSLSLGTGRDDDASSCRFLEVCSRLLLVESAVYTLETNGACVRRWCTEWAARHFPTEISVQALIRDGESVEEAARVLRPVSVSSVSSEEETALEGQLPSGEQSGTWFGLVLGRRKILGVMLFWWQFPRMPAPVEDALARSLCAHLTLWLQHRTELRKWSSLLGSEAVDPGNWTRECQQEGTDSFRLQTGDEECFLRDHNLVGRSAVFLETVRCAERWARSDAPVLILGETGTGKELIARFIHATSARGAGPFIVVNCPAIPKELAESELFGHERGAFTGALEGRAGKFELADGGTLFLDEVGDLPLPVQAKLLRVLQQGEIERLGGGRSKKVNVRIVAATNRDLSSAIARGEFREDLFYRLNALSLTIPALRHRAGDIEHLAWHFLRETCRRYRRELVGFSPEAMLALRQHSWPGNVRELQHVIERAVLVATGPLVTWEDLWEREAGEMVVPLTLNGQLRLEKQRRVEAVLKQYRGNCAQAARELGMSRGNFARLLKTLGIDPRRFKGEGQGK